MNEENKFNTYTEEELKQDGINLNYSEIDVSKINIEDKELERNQLEGKVEITRDKISNSIKTKKKGKANENTELESGFLRDSVEDMQWTLDRTGDPVSTRPRGTKDLKDAVKLCHEVFEESTEGMKYPVWARSVQRLLDYLSKYRNPYIPSDEQFRALLTTSPFVLVDACPGSGKTTTLMHKIFFDGEVLGKGKSRQLALTYTNAAARSMEQSYREISTKFNIQSTVEFGTIHAYAMNIEKHDSGGDILSERGVERVDFSQVDPEMMDFGGDMSEMPTVTITEEGILKETLEELGLTEKYSFRVRNLEGWLNIIVERMITTQEELLSLEEFNNNTFVHIKDLMNILELSRKKRKEKGVINFIDMLINFYERLKGAEDLNSLTDRTRMMMTINYLYIDEFQDMSPIQWEIAKEILRLNPQCKLYCVGDADQGIYSFRGANPKYLVEYENEVKKIGAETELIDIIYFTINRRSGTEIVNLSAEFIKNNSYRYDKQMISYNQHETNISILETKNMKKEPEDYVIKELKRLKDERQPEPGAPVDLSDIAVIYREHMQSTALKIKCIEENVLISMNGGEFPNTFSETRDILGIWDMLHQPTNAFLVEKYLYKVLESVNKERSKFVANKVRQTSKPFSSFLGENKEVNDLRSIYSDFRNKDSGMALQKTEYKYKKAYLNMFRGRNEKLELAMKYLTTFVGGTHYDFQMKKKEFDSKLSVYQNNNYGVQFYTMHGSKGLEFNDVIILPVGNKVMPKGNIMRSMTDKHKESYIEEERRLLYVAMTRAKKNLTVYVEDSEQIFPKELKESYTKVFI